MPCVIFDCDGTLIDSQHIIVDAMTMAFATQNRPPPPRQSVLSIVGLSLPQAIAKLCDARDRDLADLVEAYKSAFHTLRARPGDIEPLYDGARTAIETLSQRDHVSLGIATGKSQRGVRLVLGAHGLYDRFVTIQTADDAPSKPHPAMLQQAMADVGAVPGETVMIGDTTYDMDMARAAGATALGVAWGYHHADALLASGAAAVLGHFDDVVPWLEARGFA